MKYVRMVLLALLGGVTAYLLFGVHPGDAERRDGRVVITYWEKWGGEDAAAMQKTVDEFNNTVGRQKGIYVQYLSMANVNQKTLVATAAGVPPDTDSALGKLVFNRTVTLRDTWAKIEKASQSPGVS